MQRYTLCCARTAALSPASIVGSGVGGACNSWCVGVCFEVNPLLLAVFFVWSKKFSLYSSKQSKAELDTQTSATTIENESARRQWAIIAKIRFFGKEAPFVSVQLRN